MRRYAPFIGLGSGVLVGIVLAFVAAAAAGAGHGTYLPARLFFPLAMFSTLLFGSITAPFIIIGLVQFPAYGLLSGVSYRLHRFRACLLVIAAAHLLAVALNFVIRSEDFPNVVEKPNQAREEPRMHVHVLSPDGEAKFWLEPDIELAISKGLKPVELRELR